MKNIFFTLLASLWLSHISVLCSGLIGSYNSTEKRLDVACGDTNLAVKYFEGFSLTNKVHGLDIRPAFVNADAKGDIWQLDAASFLAWRSPGQPSTVPLYSLYNPTTTDFVYLISTNGNPPTLSGFRTAVIIAYVYPTQICGSVPLYGASPTSVNDHWYTTNLAEHDGLINEFGWTDVGVAAYVLPLNDCACGSS